MQEKEFLGGLAEIILNHVEERKKEIKSQQGDPSQFQGDILKMGHFNGNIFSKDKMFCHSLKVFVRFLLNLAMYMSAARYMQLFIDIAKYILYVADTEDASKINEAHARKKII